MIRRKILELVRDFANFEIPKPEAKKPFRIKGMGTRRGEEALIYTIPSHTRENPYEKGITVSEFEKAYRELQETGSLTRSWFNASLSACGKEGSCNFTTIGGVFQLLGMARYVERGRYDALKPQN